MKHKQGVNPKTINLLPTKIIKPLRYIRNMCAREVPNLKGEKSTEYIEPYPQAKIFAACGAGRLVNALAVACMRDYYAR